jgi:hypothetical protein
MLKKKFKELKGHWKFSRGEELALKGLHMELAKNKNGTHVKPSCQSPRQPLQYKLFREI